MTHEPDKWDDAPIPEDRAICDAHPICTGRHDIYAEAARMVNAKRSKAALVALVNWLLKERAESRAELDAIAAALHPHWRGERRHTYISSQLAERARRYVERAEASR